MGYVLGVESTAHTFGVAVVNFDGKILSNVKDSYITEKGGLIPLEVRNHHREVADGLFEEALKDAEVREDEIKVIAFSNAPGLAPCLLEGMEFVKRIAKKLDISIVEVNHCVAHLEIGDSVGARDPVMLYASGANTQIVAYESGKYRVFGETLDLGVGNFIDTFARYVGLGFPGGPKIQKLAEECENKSKLIELPYSIKGMDVAFSGLQTKLKNLLDKNSLSFLKKDFPTLRKYSLEGKAKKLSYLRDLSYSMQETVFAMLVEAAERALAHTGKKELLLGGGVACNSRLQEMCKIMCKERGVEFFCPNRLLLVDNAGMIGYLGLKMFKAGIFEKDLKKVDIVPRERTDEVTVLWK